EDLLQQVFEVGFAALPGGGGRAFGVAVDEHDIVTVAHREVSDHPGHEDRQVPFVRPRRGHGVEVAGGVDDQAEDVPAVSDIAFDQGIGVPGGGLPVDIADLVSGNVVAKIVEVEAVAVEDRGVVAVEQPPGAAMGVDGHPRLDAIEQDSHRRRRSGGGHGHEEGIDDLGARDVLGGGFEVELDPVGQNPVGEVLDVLGVDVVAAADHRQRTPGSGERDRGTRAGAVLDVWGEAAEVLARVAGGVEEYIEVPADRGVDVYSAGIALHGDYIVECAGRIRDRGSVEDAGVDAGEDLDLCDGV